MRHPTRTLDDDLIALLREDGRISSSEAARRLSAPRTLVADRIGHLIRERHLEVAAVLNPDAVGLDAMCLVLIRMSGLAEEAGAAVASHPAASFVSLTSGPHDVVAEFRARSRADMVDAIAAVRTLPGVTATSTVTYSVIAKSPFTAVAPAPAARTIVDAVDRGIIDLLQTDGRMSYREIGLRLGISDSTARARIRRLREDHVIRVTAIAKRNEVTHSVAMGIGVHTRGDTATLIATLQSRPEIEFLATAVGEYDLVCTASAATLDGLQDVVSRIRASPAVVATTSWVHLRIVKETYRAQAEALEPDPRAPRRRQ